MPVFSTACPRNCYSTCSMKVLVENGRLRMIDAHPKNMATPEGPCLKGLSYIDRVYSPHRILHPLRKKENGEFEKISWNDTFEILVDKLTSLKNEYAPQSLFYYSGSGTKGLLNRLGSDFFKLFGGYTTTYGDLCWPAGLEATRLTLGENKHNTPWDIQHSKAIIIWGKNPAETNIHQMLYIEKAREQGAKLVVIDPRRTETAERADVFIQPRPGTDAALAMGIANLLFEWNLVDKEFVQNFVIGANEYKEHVSSFTTQRVSDICGVSEKAIERLAEVIGIYKPLTINPGYGMQRFSNGGQTIRTILALAVLTGNIGKKGGGWIYGNLQSAIFDKIKEPLSYYPPNEPDGIIRISVSTSKIGADILDVNDPPLRIAWIERGNPVAQNPDTNNTIKALRSMSFRVVIDQFMNDTAKEADIILPAKSMFEQSDIIGAYWHPYIQLKQKMIEPLGQVKPESEIYRTLAELMNFPKDTINRIFPKNTDDDINRWLSEQLKPFPEITIEKLKEGPMLPPHHEEIAFEDLKFNTPSGKIEIYSEEAKERWNVHPLPDYVKPNITFNDSVYPFHLLTPNTKNSIHSQFHNLDTIRSTTETPSVKINPLDAKELHIADGDTVDVFNEKGVLTLPAAYDYSIRRKCLAIYNGWWIKDNAAVNILSKGRETDMGYGAAFHDINVGLRKRKP